MVSLTPKEIVAELDKYIIGQNDAKRAVAIALRNRWRRQQLESPLKEEVLPKNILMMGPTGVGKTEIARRLAQLAQAPFIKVEATRFTEIGYVGRDVEQIIRDLVEIALHDIKKKHQILVKDRAELNVEERILDSLVGEGASHDTREKFRVMLREGQLSDREIDIPLADNSGFNLPTFDVPGMPGAQFGMLNLSDMVNKAMGGGRARSRHVTVSEAAKLLLTEESEKLLDKEKVIHEAISAVEQNGIVFLDEIDKICAAKERLGGDVSREGVQRDLLPLIEGSSVSTRYGTVKTDHILFIASGAFHLSKPSDLLPELQGRLPIRVELNALTENDFIKILTDTEASLIKQYKALLATEGVILEFTKDGIATLAKLAAVINQNIENIGARRLHTVMEKLTEEISFTANENAGKTITLDVKYVEETVSKLANDTDLSKFIL